MAASITNPPPLIAPRRQFTPPTHLQLPASPLGLQNGGALPVLASRIFRLAITIDTFKYHAMDPTMDTCMVRYEFVAFALYRVQMSDGLLPQPSLQLTLPNPRTSIDKYIRLLHPKYPRRIL